MLYAVQYRDMHKGLHHLAIFQREAEAQDLLEYLRETESWPPDQPVGLHADVEIDFRKTYTHYKGTPLKLLNPQRCEQPDVY